MSITNLTRIAAAIIILAAISPGHALADKADLEAKLNQDIKVDLNDVTIADALKQIGEKAGIEFVLSEAAKWKLPKGEATRLSVSLEGPLADAMTQMLGDFFMRYAVGTEDVTIYPKPELNHIIGRPSVEQLKLLKTVYTSVITFGAPNSSRVFGKMLSQGLGSGPSIVITPLEDYRYICRFVDDLTSGLKGDSDQSPPMTLSQLLEMNEGSTWYISGPDFAKNVIEIRIVREDKFFMSVILEQTVDLSFEDVEAEVVIQHLKMLTEGRLIVHKDNPSWLTEKISVNMQNVRLSDALFDTLHTVGGIVESLGPAGIETRGPKPRKTQTAPQTTVSANKSTSAGEGYVGKISIPMDNGKYFLEFMLRESDLTPELRKLRELKLKEILEKASAEVAKSQK